MMKPFSEVLEEALVNEVKLAAVEQVLTELKIEMPLDYTETSRLFQDTPQQGAYRSIVRRLEAALDPKP